MGISKILYHGTSRSRWETGIRNQGLIGTMPRAIKSDNKHMGYLFFCDNLNVASVYGLQTVIMDNYTNPLFKQLNQILSNQAIILYVRSKDLPSIELDPEKQESDDWFKSNGLFGLIEKHGIYGYGTCKWFRYKGNIAKNKVHPYQDVIYDKQPPGMVEEIETATFQHLRECQRAGLL